MNLFSFVFCKMKVLKSPLRKNEILANIVTYKGWACHSMFLDVKQNIWIYLVLNSVNIKYWDNLCRENEMLAYMVANLINGKVEFVCWFKAWFGNLFGCVFGKMKVLEWPLRKNDIVAYMVTCLINMKVELVPRCPLIFEPIWF